MIAYWILAVFVAGYVGVTTGSRDEIRTMDGWEHHRAVRVMTEDGFRPGNPTYATDEPSVRYSPYTVALSMVTRWGKWDPWRVMSGAAILNTIALMLALYALLWSFERRRAALPVLLVVLFLYGSTPGYANTLAFEDLPVHQVNPSAFALPLCMLAWAGWRWARDSGKRMLLAAPLIVAALAISVLSHAMTGLLGLIGLAAVAASSESKRVRLLLATAGVAGAAFVLCAMWPYYPFLDAVLRNRNPEYWYNPAILRLMLASWCLPAMVASLLALPYRREPLVRFGIVGLSVTLCLTAAAVATRSATFARLPLAGLIFAQLLTGDVLQHWELSRLSTWREVFSRLRSLSQEAFVPGFARILVPGMLLYFGWPQLVHAAKEPHLLRPILARWLHRPDRRIHLFQQYRAVLAPVGERDVVMADPSTAWPVPSFRGRIVAAEHFELFTPDQQRRVEDAQAFMAPGTSREIRHQLIERYGVSWILLDRTSSREVQGLLVPEAIASQSDDLILMSAAEWWDHGVASRGRSTASLPGDAGAERLP